MTFYGLDYGTKLPQVKLSIKQKNVLDILQQEFKGQAYTKELLEESDSLKELSMPELTWALNQMYMMGLLKKEKGIYRGKPYTKYYISEYLVFNAIDIK